jgi:hypothetical protein
VPLDDTLNRIFSSIATKEFEKSFGKWISPLIQSFNNEVVSIDSKQLKVQNLGGGRNHLNIL